MATLPSASPAPRTAHWLGRVASIEPWVFPAILCPQLAPEHTLMSFRKALEQKLHGLQADVTIR